MIWETWQRRPEPLREALNARLGGTEAWEEWQIPRVAGDPWPGNAVKQHAIARDEEASERRRRTALGKLNTILERTYALDTLPEAR